MFDWYFAAYHWLELNSLWKSTVGWTVGLGLNSVWAIRLWVKQKAESRARHDSLVDKLDVNTPGGIADLADKLNMHTPGGIADLAKVLAGQGLEDEVEIPDAEDDDDSPVLPHRRRGHGAGVAPGTRDHGGGSMMGGVKGGNTGGSSHR